MSRTKHNNNTKLEESIMWLTRASGDVHWRLHKYPTIHLLISPPST